MLHALLSPFSGTFRKRAAERRSAASEEESAASVVDALARRAVPRAANFAESQKSSFSAKRQEFLRRAQEKAHGGSPRAPLSGATSPALTPRGRTADVPTTPRPEGVGWAMPDGWRKYTTDEGREYFVGNGVTQWEHPVVRYEDASGRPYYFEPVSGSKSWEVPEKYKRLGCTWAADERAASLLQAARPSPTRKRPIQERIAMA